jgi:hypothetical protein
LWEKQAVQAMIYGKDDARFVETPVAEPAQLELSPARSS